MTDCDTITTKLLTLLNVSASKPRKRRRLLDDLRPLRPVKRKLVTLALSEDGKSENVNEIASKELLSSDDRRDSVADDEEKDDELHTTAYNVHFGPEPSILSDKSRDSAEQGNWDILRKKKGRLGNVTEYIPEGLEKQMEAASSRITDKLRARFESQQEQLPKHLRELQDTLLSEFANYQDFYLSRTSIETSPHLRNAIALHALNHIMRKRRRIVKNNDRLAHSSKDASVEPPTEIRDQGFARPSVLILLPFRSWALRWIESLIGHIPKPEFQIENHSRLISEYGLPPGAVDKLESVEQGTYPQDHVEMFKGNIDDSFRIGVKITRKSVKLFANFYQCDLIVASPLGLRMSIEKENNADFLSSIELLIVDQLDALSMQNWDHLQLVLTSLNTLPKETRDADFSRIKPWYLDGHATFLRQTILLSPYDTPEFRSIFNHLKNVAGKKQAEGTYKPIQVPEGISQSFIRFECNSHKDEADKRYECFAAKILPQMLKSAVQSTNTVVFVPSSFDFIRVRNLFRKHGGISFAVLSEYSSNQDVSRARQAFFSGKMSFLLVSERFHFFRRYKIRGIRNLIFYALPEHPLFYTEYLTYPFLDDGVEPRDVTCKALFCKYDWMRLERIAGSDGAASLLRSSS